MKRLPLRDELGTQSGAVTFRALAFGRAHDGGDHDSHRGRASADEGAAEPVEEIMSKGSNPLTPDRIRSFRRSSSEVKR